MQEQTPYHALETRVRRLEAANRRLLAGILVLGSLILVGSTASPPSSDVIRGGAFEVVDAAGRVQARLASTEEGAELQLLDPAGVSRASLEHGAEGTALYLKDSEGTTRVGVAQFAHGGGGFALHGEESKGAAVLYLKGGAGALTFYGPDGAVLSRVPDQP